MGQNTFTMTIDGDTTINDSNNGIGILSDEHGLTILSAGYCQDVSCNTFVQVNYEQEVVWKRKYEAYPLGFNSSLGSFIKNKEDNYISVSGFNSGLSINNGLLQMNVMGDSLSWFIYCNGAYGILGRGLWQMPDSSYIAGYGIGDPTVPGNNYRFLKRISKEGTIIDSIQIDYELYGAVFGLDTCHNGYMMMEPAWEEFILTSPKYAVARRTDTLGVPIWEHHFTATDPEGATGWALTMPNGDVAVTWATPDTVINGDEDAFPYRKFVACLDGENGNQLWKVFFEEEWIKEIAGIKLARNGDIIGVGTDLGEGSGWLFRISPQGQLLWEHTYDNLTNPDIGGLWGGCQLYDLCETPDGGIAATGYIVKKNADNQWESDVWLLKVDANGCLTPGCNEPIIDIGVSVEEVAAPPQVTGAYAVYPNPATNNITIYYDVLPHNKPIEFAIYDAAGRLQYQKSIVDYSPRRNADISYLPEGLYFYTFSQNQQVLSSGKLLKLPSR